MHSLAYGFDVVDVPEQRWVASMRPLVVGHGTVGCWMLADTHHACPLALVEVADEYLLTQPLPPCRLVPGAPWSQLVAALVCCLGIAWGIADAGRESAD